MIREFIFYGWIVLKIGVNEKSPEEELPEYLLKQLLLSPALFLTRTSYHNQIPYHAPHHTTE